MAASLASAGASYRWTPLAELAWSTRLWQVTFAGLYLIMNVASLACRLHQDTQGDATGDSSIAILGGNASVGSSTESPVDGSAAPRVCRLVNSDGLVWTMVTNSILLATLRF